MDGMLIASADTRYYWFVTRCLLLDADQESNFRKSYLRRPQREEAYGDKDVCHRKMEGSVKPSDIQNLPWEWSHHSLDYPWPYYIDYTYESGTDFCFCQGLQQNANGYIYNAYRTEWRFVVADGIKKMQTRNMHINGIGYGQPDWNIAEGQEWYDAGPWKDNEGWHDLGRYNLIKTTFKPGDPYYPWMWLQYMDSIKPYEPRDTEALSEVIRNTIAENTSYNTNNYANFLEVVDLIRDFRNGKFYDLIEDQKKFYRYITDMNKEHVSSKRLRSFIHGSGKKAANGWLKYRYAYQTTKADVDQYTRAKIGEYLGALDDTRVLRGKIDILNGELRVKMRLHDDTSPNFTKMLIGLEQYGLYPGLYNLWDMMPYSFIADWGSHLGDYLEDLDQSIFFHYYKVDELLVTEKRVLDRDEPWGLTTYTWYDRYLLHEMPQWEIYEEGPKSKTTVCKRVLDAMSLAVSMS